MKKDAHYYAVLAFSRACGFTKSSAYIIAYASQFVDDAIINHIVIKGNIPKKVKCRKINNRNSFYNMATCHSYTRIKTFNYSSMINNTCAFHFVPGCEGENFPRKLQCKENSRVIQKIMKEALKDNNLVKFGMVLHTFADTFSHWGFSGLLSKINDIRKIDPKSGVPWGRFNKILKGIIKLFNKKFDKILDKGMPAYGHGQALIYPDLPFLKWSYEYDASELFCGDYIKITVNNKKKFKRAFQAITGYLKSYLDKYPQHKDKLIKFDNDKFDILYDTLVTKQTDNGREKTWIDLLIKYKFFDKEDPRLKYDKDLWLEEAFKNFKRKKFRNRFHKRKVEDVALNKNFSNSNWYKYYEAQKWYKDKFFNYCEKFGLKIP